MANGFDDGALIISLFILEPAPTTSDDGDGFLVVNFCQNFVHGILCEVIELNGIIIGNFISKNLPIAPLNTHGVASGRIAKTFKNTIFGWAAVMPVENNGLVFARETALVKPADVVNTWWCADFVSFGVFADW